MTVQVEAYFDLHFFVRQIWLEKLEKLERQEESGNDI